MSTIQDEVARLFPEFVGTDPLDETEMALVLAEDPARCQALFALLQRQMEEQGDLRMVVEEGRLPRLNPLYEAAIIERLQFDGDIPELRTTALPAGSRPAVPVATTSLNPIVIGLALDEASNEVAAKAAELRASALISFDDGIASGQLALTGTDCAGLSVLDPEGYQRGQEPRALVVRTPGGAELASLSENQKSKAAWSLLSTTPGRRSAVSPIASYIAKILLDKGVTVTPHIVATFPVPDDNEIGRVQWVVPLDQGEWSTQHRFSILTVAASVLAIRLRALVPVGGTDYVLEVTSVDAISDRLVGWAARLVTGA